jgi:formamidopyrimidine-DNA glycosylase
MPESCETKKSTDFLVTRLKFGEKWATFKGLAMFPNTNKKFNDLNLELVRKCLDKPVRDIFCKGKHFFIQLAEDVTIHAHQIMKGWWADEYEEGAQFKLSFTNEDRVITIYFVNKRFGLFEILNEEEVTVVLDKLAPSFFGRPQDLITEEVWMQRFGKFTKSKNLRNLLMDQGGLVSGVGNYLLAEIFYRFRINSETKVGDLTTERRRELFWICWNLVMGIYECRESKVVYKKEFDPEGNPVKSKKMGDNRTFWYVPAVQGD